MIDSSSQSRNTSGAGEYAAWSWTARGTRGSCLVRRLHFAAVRRPPQHHLPRAEFHRICEVGMPGGILLELDVTMLVRELTAEEWFERGTRFSSSPGRIGPGRSHASSRLSMTGGHQRYVLIASSSMCGTSLNALSENRSFEYTNSLNEQFRTIHESCTVFSRRRKLQRALHRHCFRSTRAENGDLLFRRTIGQKLGHASSHPRRKNRPTARYPRAANRRSPIS